jgi:hypothetical protein
MTESEPKPEAEDSTGEVTGFPEPASPETVKIPEEILLSAESASATIPTTDVEQPGDEVIRPRETIALEPDQPPAPPPPLLPPAPAQPQPLAPSEERTWAMLAHLSVLANLLTGFLGPVIALIIYLVFRDRSRYVAYQSMQAFVFQLLWWVAAGALAGIAWAISFILAAVVIGFCLMPFALLISLMPLGALVYGVIGAIQVNQGQDFQYWLVGKWTRGILSGR